MPFNNTKAHTNLLKRNYAFSPANYAFSPANYVFFVPLQKLFKDTLPHVKDSEINFSQTPF